VVQANALDHAGFVAREDGGAPDILAECLAFPLEVRLETIDRLIGEDQQFVHADGSLSKECCNRIDPDAGAIQHRGVQHRLGDEGGDEFLLSGDAGELRAKPASCRFAYERSASL